MTPAETGEPLVRISDLHKSFQTPSGRVRAVDGVDLEIARGRTLALVGESASGKSTLARCVLRLTAWDEGRVEIDGDDVGALHGRRLRRFRRHAQMVFQDPYGSLNPRLRVCDIIGEPLELHSDLDRRARQARIDEMLSLVHLDPSYALRYPAELSGGEQQRVGIARAIVTEPQLVVLDEPTAALDAHVRQGILKLLRDLQERMGLTYLLISHDLTSVWNAAHEVAVMYLGRIVERGPRDAVFGAPAHPYTIALLSAAPRITADSRGKERLVLSGENRAGNTTGCRFSDRCPAVAPACHDSDPALEPVAGAHAAACRRIDAVRTQLAAHVTPPPASRRVRDGCEEVAP